MRDLGWNPASSSELWSDRKVAADSTSTFAFPFHFLTQATYPPVTVENGKQTYLDAMWRIVDMMKIRLGIPEIGSPVNDSRPPHRYFQSVSSPRITEDDLPRPKITWTGHLELKQSDALEPRAEKAEAVGKNGSWSSANLHSHLEHLRTLARNPVGRFYRFQDTDLMLGIISE